MCRKQRERDDDDDDDVMTEKASMKWIFTVYIPLFAKARAIY